MNNLIDAKRDFVFEITEEDIRNARRHDKEHCVVANALREAPGITKVEVGSRYTRVWTRKKEVIRYQTDKDIRLGLNRFDETGVWTLPRGVYSLRVPTPGRTLQHERDYEKKRTETQIQNKHRKVKPENNGKHRPVPVNPRVIVFAGIRKTRKE